MVTMATKLTAKTLASAKTPGRYPTDEKGLSLIVSATKSGVSRRWDFRYRWREPGAEASKQYTEGLGSPDNPHARVLLADAKRKALDIRAAVARGEPPHLRAAVPQAPALPTFGDVAERWLLVKLPTLANEKHSAQVAVTLRKYGKPIWPRPVAEVRAPEVADALREAWAEVPETAARARARIEAVFDFALASEARGRANPAANDLMRALLGERQGDKGHHAAMPWAEVPALWQRLEAIRNPSVSLRALQFLILTAVRTGEVIGASWDEIDLPARLWTISAERMKAGVEHRVPLSGAALDVLSIVGRLGPAVKAGRGYVFPGARDGEPLSYNSLHQFRVRLELPYTVHGFRTSFRTWCADHGKSAQAAEFALSHKLPDAVERAYQRSDLLAERVPLMQEWADYVTGARGAASVPTTTGAA